MSAQECPLCGYAFDDESIRARMACDHEAGWYRRWLADGLDEQPAPPRG